MNVSIDEHFRNWCVWKNILSSNQWMAETSGLWDADLIFGCNKEQYKVKQRPSFLLVWMPYKQRDNALGIYILELLELIFSFNSTVLCRFIMHSNFMMNSIVDSISWNIMQHNGIESNEKIITLILQRVLMRCHVTSNWEKDWFMNLWEMINLIHVWWTFISFDCSKIKITFKHWSRKTCYKTK